MKYELTKSQVNSFIIYYNLYKIPTLNPNYKIMARVTNTGFQIKYTYFKAHLVSLVIT